MMNDFFADLDADLWLEAKVPKSPVRQTTSESAVAIPRTPRETYSQNNHPVIPKPSLIPRATFEPKQVPARTPVVPQPEFQQKAVPAKREYAKEDHVNSFALAERLPVVFPQTRFQSLPSLAAGTTRIITVGGQNEAGKSMTVFQYGDEILLVNTGIHLSAYAKQGAKCSLPDLSFLIPLKNKIVGLFVTNSHFEQIGGLKHILSSLGYPKIYTTKLTAGLIKRQLQNTEALARTSFHIVNPDSDGIFNISPSFRAEFFRTAHNTTDSVGVYLETPEAKIAYMADAKCDTTSANEANPMLSKIGEIGKRGIDILLADSANSMKDGFAKTEVQIDRNLEDIITRAPGRIIIAVSSSLTGRIQKVINSAEATGKTVFLSGQAMIETLGIARDLWYLQHTPNRVRRLTSKMEATPLNEQIILTTESREEEVSGLHRIASGDNQIVQIRPGDTVVLSSALGSENGAKCLMNDLIRLGATLFTIEGMDTSSGHGAREDQKLLLSTMMPYNLMPVHGELFMRVAHKQTAMALGVPDESIFLVDNGAIVDIDAQGHIERNKSKLQLEEIIVDGHGLGVATGHVIEARCQMMQSGVVTIVCKIDEKSRALLGHLKLETRGLVYLDEVREIHKIIIKKARASYEDTVKDIPDIEEKDLLKIIRRDMEIFLEQKMGRTPLIIPIFIYV